MSQGGGSDEHAQWWERATVAMIRDLEAKGEPGATLVCGDQQFYLTIDQLRSHYRQICTELAEAERKAEDR